LSSIPEIELRENEQLELLDKLASHLKEFSAIQQNQPSNWRYYPANGYFEQADAALLFAMIRHYKPSKIIEVGSGFSSALMLDINEQFLDNAINLTFIEPYPERLNTLISGPFRTPELIQKKVQHVPVEFFSQLEAGDMLFIDSSHVSKTGSDLNYLLFQVLPQLKKGVYIHFHDIFFPFEYPEHWVLNWFKGFGWNEVYLLKAFLMNNTRYKIVYFNSFMNTYHKEKTTRFIPEAGVNTGGSIWIQKL
jgi:predicted O-methyltransferase YrrM